MGIYSQGGRVHQFNVRANQHIEPILPIRDEPRAASVPLGNRGGESRDVEFTGASQLQQFLKSFAKFSATPLGLALESPDGLLSPAGVPLLPSAGNMLARDLLLHANRLELTLGVDRSRELSPSPDTRSSESDALERDSFPATSELPIQPAPSVLPITKHREQIERMMLTHPIGIIEGATGSGKSLGPPDFLRKMGFFVDVCQPRRVAASSLAERLSEISGTVLGKEIGYRHGLAAERSPDTQVLFTTFGSELRHQLMCRNDRHKAFSSDKFPELAAECDDRRVVVFDEFHELTAEAEVLLGFLLWQRALTGKGPRILIMSATMNSKKLSYFLDGAPIVQVEGRCFPIEHIPGSGSFAEDIAIAARMGKNTLLFLYGKSEISQQMEEVASLGLPIDLIPFHSGLMAKEMARALEPYKRATAVFATNAAQTSLTMPELNQVICSGLVRRRTFQNGIESLVIDKISLSELYQQWGRVGRTGPGGATTYIDDIKKLAKDVPPEIQNINLDSLVLQALAAGYDLEQIVQYCYNKPLPGQIEEAKDRLFNLGLIGPQGHITASGRFAANIPVAPNLGKILYTAMHEGKQLNRNVLETAIDMVAVAEGEGFARGDREAIFKLIGFKTHSEMVAQGALLELCVAEGRKGLGVDNDTNESRVFVDQALLQRALDLRANIRESLGLDARGKTRADRDEDAGKIVRNALCSGFVNSVFRFSHVDGESHVYRSIQHGGEWMLNKDSLANGAPYVIGRPLNIQFMKDSGEIGNAALVMMTSAVDRSWLLAHLPQERKADFKAELLQQQKNESRERKTQHQRELRRPPRSHGGGRR